MIRNEKSRQEIKLDIRKIILSAYVWNVLRIHLTRFPLIFRITYSLEKHVPCRKLLFVILIVF